MSNHIKVAAVINPFSGTKSKESLIMKLREELTAPAFELEIYYTEYRGHAKVIVKELRDHVNIVIAIGGDGTINEVASGLVNSETSLAIIPMGSGNGLARHLNLYQKHDVCIELIKKAHSIQIDTCLFNNTSFFNVAGVGIDAKVAYKTRKNCKRGLWHYVKASLKYGLKYQPFSANLTIDNQSISGKYKTIVIANGSLYGYNFSIAPQADIQDGKIDIMLFEEAQVWKYLLALPKFMTAKLDKVGFVKIYKATSCVININNQKHHFHLDGEGYKGKEENYTCSVIPASLKVIV